MQVPAVAHIVTAPPQQQFNAPKRGAQQASAVVQQSESTSRHTHTSEPSLDSSYSSDEDKQGQFAPRQELAAPSSVEWRMARPQQGQVIPSLITGSASCADLPFAAGIAGFGQMAPPSSLAAPPSHRPTGSSDSSAPLDAQAQQQTLATADSLRPNLGHSRQQQQQQRRVATPFALSATFLPETQCTQSAAPPTAPPASISAAPLPQKLSSTPSTSYSAPPATEQPPPAAAAAAAAAPTRSLSQRSGGSRPRSASLAAPSFTAEEAQLARERAQEKNRSAQARFRQRQKEAMDAVQTANTVLQKQVASLQTENSSLRSMNGVLEKVLSYRDEHIDGLRAMLQQLEVGPGKRSGSSLEVGGRRSNPSECGCTAECCRLWRAVG
jgi:hypothetical protein